MIVVVSLIKQGQNDLSRHCSDRLDAVTRTAGFELGRCGHDTARLAVLA